MSTERKRNRFLNARRDGSAYTPKPELSRSTPRPMGGARRRWKRDMRTVNYFEVTDEQTRKPRSARGRAAANSAGAQATGDHPTRLVSAEV